MMLGVIWAPTFLAASAKGVQLLAAVQSQSREKGGNSPREHGSHAPRVRACVGPKFI